ncbi:protein adenylyltransferase SelO [Macrococcus brunensis]|uniref:protein adenylyltransferase SelO n=1 Tax=Macrococcus brunensis TaxID=198483 RepID=UPI001EF0BCBA|nr:YdiU family protein [Macrococcus brunensis]ULG72057.1 YdiU family protein [Macrococcus brunensis]ULG74310.1 YdiU family protein [Macrococcus brunensis]
MNTYFNFDNSYRQLSTDFYDLAELNPVSDPAILILNEKLADQLGFDIQTLKSSAEELAGSKKFPHSEPLAQAYAGHQFGNFTMLGDGRAVLLGEHVTPDGTRYDIQLKGSGRTAFSRMGDGRAPLAPMLREYLISEAMHALGIPTTRSLAVTATGDTVRRETELPGAVLTRIASSHIRVGTFEYAVRQGIVKELADYAINRHYPELAASSTKYIDFLYAVIDRQAALIAKWQSIGFIHGVMNTDNMTVSGETIDYGPCAFMDSFDRATVFSSIDRGGRYAYYNQPGIGQWNLARFAESLIPLFSQETDAAIETAKDALTYYETQFDQYWLSVMAAKIGIQTPQTEDRELIGELLSVMEDLELDFTRTFRQLSLQQPVDSALDDWKTRWQERITTEDAPYKLMKKVNPAIIPRNHLVEKAVNSSDLAFFKELLAQLENPYSDDHPELYSTPPEETEQVFQTYCGT